MARLLILFILLFSSAAYSQKKLLFTTYSDSAILVQDANRIVQDFTQQIDAIQLVFSATPATPASPASSVGTTNSDSARRNSVPLAVLNTKPFLIFYSPKANLVNLPLWEQVIPEQKKFFFSLGGDEQKGKELFGLFFNGFYLSHELAHALQNIAKKQKMDLYQGEYFANIVGILYWRKANRNKELEQCYQYAKHIVAQLKNPVPDGEDPVKYFNEHYAELGRDPYKYGYFQFAQFVKIYEDKSLQQFDSFIRDYLKK